MSALSSLEGLYVEGAPWHRGFRKKWHGSRDESGRAIESTEFPFELFLVGLVRSAGIGEFLRFSLVEVDTGEKSESSDVPDLQTNQTSEGLIRDTEVEQKGATGEAAQEQTVSTLPLPDSHVEDEGFADPTYRIGNMPDARKELVTVNSGEPIQKAVFLMMKNGFSQIPIMNGERDVKGVVTWEQIGRRCITGNKCKLVNDCSEPPQIIDSEHPVLDAIATIVNRGYVCPSSGCRQP